MTHTPTTFAAYWCGSIGPVASSEEDAASAFFLTFPRHAEALVRPVLATWNGVPQFTPGRGSYVTRPVSPRAGANLRRVK